ncbi:reverse transcriptase domain-containing protein [Tanacetum coccineum]
MCDASKFAVGTVLGRKDGKHFHPIYFASKTLNAAHQSYTVTEKELMVVVFAFVKFRPFLVLSKTVVYTDHSALKHLFKKQDAKPCLIHWILVLQEFDIEIKEKKGTAKIAADHLSRIENDETSDDDEIDNNFPDETLVEISAKEIPWFADFANYSAGDIIPKGMTYQQKNKFFSDLKNYFWEEPHLFKICFDGAHAATIIFMCLAQTYGSYLDYKIRLTISPNIEVFFDLPNVDVLDGGYLDLTLSSQCLRYDIRALPSLVLSLSFLICNGFVHSSLRRPITFFWSHLCDLDLEPSSFDFEFLRSFILHHLLDLNHLDLTFLIN